VFKGHKGAVTALAIHPSRPVLYSGGADKNMREWVLDSGQVHTGRTPLCCWVLPSTQALFTARPRVHRPH
jgi:hypothetical protein